MIKFCFILLFLTFSTFSNESIENIDTSNYHIFLKKVLYFIQFPPYSEREKLVILLEEKKQLEQNRLKDYLIELITQYNLEEPKSRSLLYKEFRDIANLGGIQIFHWNSKIIDYSYKKIDNYQNYSSEFEYKNYKVIFFLARKSNYHNVFFDTVSYNSDYFYFQKDGSLLYYEEKFQKYSKKISEIEKKIELFSKKNPYIYKGETKGFILYIIPNFENYFFFSLLIGKIVLVIFGFAFIFYMLKYFIQYLQDKKNVYKQLEKILK